MRLQCPVCGFENLTGAEVCDNCGADLAGHDVPEAATSFHGRVMGGHLDALGVADPVTVDPDTPLSAVIARMHDAAVDCVLVVHDDRLLGIFTDRDAVMKAAGRDVAGVRVDELMTRDPVVLRHDDPIAVAINKMAVGGFRHIPILEDGRPTGVVSAPDIFRHLISVLD